MMAKRKSGKKTGDQTKQQKTQKEHKDVVPDRQSEEYYHDEIDRFHVERDTIPLDTKFCHERDESESEEEVLALESGDSDDSDDDNLDAEMAANLSRLQRNLAHEDMASDVEDDEDGLPDSQAWGKLRHKYYGADVDDEDDIESNESDMGAAELEEQEALAIQKRLAEHLEEEDFGLHMIKVHNMNKRAKKFIVN